MPGRSTDQLDELVLIGGHGRPTHPLAADERDEDLLRPVDIDVLDVGVAPQRIELTEAVDVSHHGVEHGLVGVVGKRSESAADACLVESGQLAMDLGDRGDLLGVGRQLRTRGERFLDLAGDPLANGVGDRAHEGAELIDGQLAECRVNRLTRRCEHQDATSPPHSSSGR